MNLVPQLSTADNNILRLVEHPIFSADSYKYSHFFQLNQSTKSMYNHYLNRGGKEEATGKLARHHTLPSLSFGYFEEDHNE